MTARRSRAATPTVRRTVLARVAFLVAIDQNQQPAVRATMKHVIRRHRIEMVAQRVAWWHHVFIGRTQHRRDTF